MGASGIECTAGERQVHAPLGPDKWKDRLPLAYCFPAATLQDRDSRWDAGFRGQCRVVLGDGWPAPPRGLRGRVCTPPLNSLVEIPALRGD